MEKKKPIDSTGNEYSSETDVKRQALLLQGFVIKHHFYLTKDVSCQYWCKSEGYGRG